MTTDSGTGLLQMRIMNAVVELMVFQISMRELLCVSRPT